MKINGKGRVILRQRVWGDEKVKGMGKIGESVNYYIFNFFLNKKDEKIKINNIEDLILFQC